MKCEVQNRYNLTIFTILLIILNSCNSKSNEYQEKRAGQFDFRKVYWGMTKDDVKKSEDSKLLMPDTDENTLMYAPIPISGKDYFLNYGFINDSLVFASYDRFIEKDEDAFKSFESFKDLLSEKLGNPQYDKPKFKGNFLKELLDTSNHFGKNQYEINQAVFNGEATLGAVWKENLNANEKIRFIKLMCDKQDDGNVLMIYTNSDSTMTYLQNRIKKSTEENLKNF